MPVVPKRLPSLSSSLLALGVGGAALLSLLLPNDAWQAPVQAAEAATSLPAPAVDAPVASEDSTETAVLAGGCFWGVQGVFQHVKGVKQVVSGYAGGKSATAHYELVGTGTTGHAESVQITFDPHQISYGQLLRIFFSVATDPTQVNRQFPDSGPQYRSEIFYAGPAQRDIAQRYIAQLDQAHVFGRPIATRVDPDQGFFPAEDYHQDYLTRHPDSPYIATYDLPKIENLKRLFPDAYVGQPVLVATKG
jgi:peptide-methionine (S)-S-oxide reductase